MCSCFFNVLKFSIPFLKLIRVGGGSSGPRDAVSVDTYNQYDYGTSGSGTGISINSAGAHTHTLSGNTDSTGSSGTNANLPPYIVVKMWQRTA